jgi:ACS family hexuronate transporter-like MFS transporter
MGLTFPCHLFPQDVVASVTGLSGLGAGLAGAFFTVVVGKLVDRFSYYPAFFAAATIPLIATAAVLMLLHPAQGYRPNHS